ncbi:MAG TPA: AAA family ATPase [Blastocatellia bacterium]|nr:AAA family ATPase [Blastocatellia bacterium]
MRKSAVITFPPFQLEVENQTLRRNNELITLSPKPFAVLLYLLQKPGRLVTKSELLDACWTETAVTDTVLKVCIRQIREVLEDDARSPKFIETSHRRGYRFIGNLSHTSALESSQSDEAFLESFAPILPQGELVGRGAELARMSLLFKRAEEGKRQVVFITGEAGIGKTALIEAFLKTLGSAPGIHIARGQCLEQFGASEAYLPVLEAVSRLARESNDPKVVDMLFRNAPTWVAQMPTLMSVNVAAALRREILGATRDRMVREMAETLEALSKETTCVLVLEDLHWSDYSTVDLLSAIAARREPARLMLIGTYRPVDLILQKHPFKAVMQELQGHGRCELFPLEYLSEQAITDYLGKRFAGHQFPLDLAHIIQHRTEGNPLFVVNLIDFFISQGLIVHQDGAWNLVSRLGDLEVGMPENIRQMITRQIERLSSEDQQVLEAASLCGMRFSALAVASALGIDLIEVEDKCEELARKSYLLKASGTGEFPDGTVSARYGFTHSLYLNTLCDRVPAARAVRLHLLIAEQGEKTYRDRVGEIAAELAMHFEQGRDYQKAVKYLRHSADIDSRRYAGREAVENLEQALKLVRRLPEQEQQGAQIALIEQRGMARRAMGDMTTAAADFMELARLSQESDQVETEARALLHAASAFSWVERQRCPQTFERAVTLIPKLQNELMKTHVRAYWGYWHSRFIEWRHEDEQASKDAINAARQAGDRALLSMHVARYTYYLCLRSDYESACLTAEEGSWLTLEAGDGFDYLYCLFYWGWALLHAGEWGKLRAVLRTAVDVAQRNGQNILAALLDLENTWLYLHALDFEHALDSCNRILSQTGDDKSHETANFLGLILRGTTLSGLGQYKLALECFQRIDEKLGRDQVMMEWIFRLPLQYGLSQCLLGLGDVDQAREAARALCEAAGLPGERTYVALGHQMLAEIALSADELNRGEHEIAHALETLKGASAPLADWRVHETAALLYEKIGRTDAAAQHWTSRTNVLRRLAESLDQLDALRGSLLNAAKSDRFNPNPPPGH